MEFTVHPGVRPRGRADTTPRIPIFYNNGTKPSFVCVVGQYMFTNSVSATVFSYLAGALEFSVAEAVVLRMEQKLDKLGARWADKAPSAFDFVTMLPVGKYIEIGKKAIETGGAAFMNQQIADEDLGQYNQYAPRAGRTMTGYACDEYVDYALLYWGKYKKGPAYILGRDNPAYKTPRR